MNSFIKILVPHRPLLYQLKVIRSPKVALKVCSPRGQHQHVVLSEESVSRKSSNLATCQAIVFLTTVLGLRAANSQHDVAGDAEVLAFGDKDEILKLIEQSKKMVAEKNYSGAKVLLQKALVTTESAKEYKNLPVIYDLLVMLAIQEGKISEAEEMLVRFIEKFIQIGYADTDNQIVRYKLKLSRLYQIVGNSEMAEIGYQNCVRTQEDKIKGGVMDAATQSLYMSSLFWYGRFLTEGSDLVKAQQCMLTALENERAHHVLEPIQLMVFLFHTAEISFKLNEFADSMKYLAQGLEVCLQNDPDNAELPVFLVKMGVVCYHLKLYEESRYWCEKGLYFARLRNNRLAEEEASVCMKNMEKLGVLVDKIK